MAMDALKNLVNNIPDWQSRLDDLASQVEKRQAELAAVAAADPKAAETRSLRNTGSTESLKPKNEGPAQPNDPSETADAAHETNDPMLQTFTQPQVAPGQQPASSSPNDGTFPAGVKHSRDAVAVHSRARVHAKRRQRSASMISAEGAPATYRTRSMIIVYYDSHVQEFFDELVRFTSSSRNMMRKAKMAAKVAQIKRMAEKEVSEEGDDTEDGEDDLPSLRYMTGRRTGPMAAMARTRFGGGGPGTGQPPDIYDTLDKSLEVVQSTCEHGAHQFLRDADCNDEIKRIHKRLGEVFENAGKELERIEREEPELAKETGDAGKIRTRRQISMRRELSASKVDSLVQARDDTSKIEVNQGAAPTANPALASSQPLEVDTRMEVDEGIDVEQDLPKIQYRSTRQMGRREINSAKC